MSIPQPAAEKVGGSEQPAAHTPPGTATPLSACIIAFNEADRIVDCIDSLGFCDEIVVVDSGSTDRTAELARGRGARVVQHPFRGFASQKQFAVQQCRHDWVLCLDADERVSPHLRASIAALRSTGFAGAAGFRMPRLSNYYGRYLRHGNAYPDRVLRLFDRRRGGWREGREVHERVQVTGPVERLEGDLLHLPFRSLQQQLRKQERYARMMAEHAFQQGRRASLLKLVLAPTWRFLRGYVMRLGFLDGWHGLVYAFLRASYVRQKTVCLWMLQQGIPLDDPTPAAPAAQTGEPANVTAPRAARTETDA